MKKILFTLALISTAFAVGYTQRSQGQSFVQYYTAPDKLLHTSIGYSISSTVTTSYALFRPDEPLINSVGVGIMAGTLVGGLKEVAFDHYGGWGEPDAGDFYATMMGSIVGSLVTATIIRWSRNLYKKKSNKVGVDFITGEEVKL